MNVNIDITGVEIKTNRLLLRPFKESDLDDFFQYASVIGVGELAGWPHHESKKDSKYILDKFIEHKKTFAITIDGKVIGSLGIEEYDENLFPEFEKLRGRELGFVLSKSYWGLGLMPEAVNAVIDYLFKELNLDFLLCRHFDFNNQSRRVQEKVGFIKYKEVERGYSDLWNKEYIDICNILFKEDWKK